MIRKKPTFDLSRSGNTATLLFTNWAGEEVYVYRADAFKNQFKQIATLTDDSYVDNSLQTGFHYKYYIRMTDIASSIRILEDYTDQVPPYYEAEAIGGSGFIEDEYSVSVSWGDDINVDIITVTNLSAGVSSVGKFTK